MTGIVESIRRTRKVEKAFSPFHKGDGHVTDDTLMTRVLVHAYDVKRDHLDAYDVEALMVPAIVDEKTWVPELDREDLLYHRLFLAEKWLVLKLRYGHADPRDAGSREHRQLRRRDVHRSRRDRERGRPADGAYDEAIDLTAAHQSSYGREAAGVLAAAVAEAMRLEATPETVVETCLRLAKDGTRYCDRGGRGGGGEARRLARRRARRAETCLLAVRLGRRALRDAGAERADPEQAALDRGAADRDRSARRDRRRLRGDRPRRRQLRPGLGLDRLDGRRARGRTRRIRSAAISIDDVSAASKIDVEEAGRTMAVVAAEIFERDVQRHQERARALAALAAGEVPA